MGKNIMKELKFTRQRSPRTKIIGWDMKIFKIEGKL